MRLTRLKLENFRGFESLELEFHPEVTVLVGVNGSGKTTILDALAMELAGITGSGGKGWYSRASVRDGAEEAVVGIWGSFGDSPVEIRHHFRDERTVKPMAGLMPAFQDEQRRNGPLPILSYYPVSRHADDETPGARDPKEWIAANAWTGSLYSNRTTFGDFFRWYRDREDLENESIRDNPDYQDKQLEVVRSALERLLPGYERPRVNRQPTPVLTVRKNDHVLSFDQLSEGERTLAALGCDIARRLALANPSGDPLNGCGIVLIDEIDLHLHPEWQRSIIPALRRTFPAVQFVVTTHSPIVLGHIEAECVRVIDDFRVVEKLPKTWGRDPNSLLEDIFHQPLRPEEVSRCIREIAERIDGEDLDGARAKLDELKGLVSEDDGEVVRYEAMLELLGD